MRRTLAALLVTVAVIASAQPSRAANPSELPAPVLISPVGGSAPLADLELQWQRVPGAQGYRVVAYHTDRDGIRLLDAYTVNDRWDGRLPNTTGTIWWEVTAVAVGTYTAHTAHATFTAVPTIPASIWPPDGAALEHPVDTVNLVWSSTGELYDPELTKIAEAGDPSAAASPATGTWSWQPTGYLRSFPTLPKAPDGELRTFSYTWPDNAPELLEPADGAHVDSGAGIRLSWNAVAGADAYVWELLDAQGRVARHGPGLENETMATWGDVPPLTSPGTYTWRVRSRLAGTEWPHGAFGAWSTQRTLVIDPAPAPVPRSPADGAVVDGFPLLRWEPVDGVHGYQLQVAASASDPETYWNTTLPAFDFQAARYRADLYGAIPGTPTRYWRVRAENGAWSPWRSFTVAEDTATLDTPQPATLLGPDDCANDTCPAHPGLPVLAWEPVPGATWYRVFAAWPDDSGSPRVYDTGSMSAALPTAFGTRGEAVRWNVIACPPEQCPAEMPAGGRHFRIEMPAPVLATPADGATLAGPAMPVAWTMPDPPDDVVLPNPTFRVSPTTEYGGTILPRQGISAGTRTFATLEGFFDGMTVTWSVTAAWDRSAVDARSEIRSYTRTEQPPPIMGPDPDVPQDEVPLLSWQAPGYAAYGYTVQLGLAGDDTPDGSPRYRWQMPASGTSVRPSFPLPPGDYRWRVARASGQYGPEGGGGPPSFGTFTVAGDRDIHLLAPAPGSTVAADDIHLAWTPTDQAMDSHMGVAGYVVLIGRQPDLTVDNADMRVWTDVPRLSPTTSLPEGALYWRVCWALSCSAVGSLTAGVSPVRAMIVVGALGGPDLVDPVMTTRPKVALKAHTNVTSRRARIATTWAASDMGTGVDHYDLRLLRDGKAWSERTADVPSAALSVAPGHTWQLKVRAVDGAGNASAWSASRRFSVAFRQDSSASIRWTGTWQTRNASRYWGGSIRKSADKGATATTTFTGRGIAWVSDTSPSRGTAKVYLDGRLAATVSLEGTSLVTSRVVWQTSFPTTGTHTVRIKVLGQPDDHPRVDMDGLIVLR